MIHDVKKEHNSTGPSSNQKTNEIHVKEYFRSAIAQNSFYDVDCIRSINNTNRHLQLILLKQQLTWQGTS